MIWAYLLLFFYIRKTTNTTGYTDLNYGRFFFFFFFENILNFYRFFDKFDGFGGIIIVECEDGGKKILYYERFNHYGPYFILITAFTLLVSSCLFKRYRIIRVILFFWFTCRVWSHFNLVFGCDRVIHVRVLRTNALFRTRLPTDFSE